MHSGRWRNGSFIKLMREGAPAPGRSRGRKTRNRAGTPETMVGVEKKAAISRDYNTEGSQGIRAGGENGLLRSSSK